MICMVCIMSDDNNEYSVTLQYDEDGYTRWVNLYTEFDNENEALEYARNYASNDMSLIVFLNGSDIWTMGDDEAKLIEDLKEENEQLKDEIKQLKLQLEKQTLSNVLDKKIPLGTKSDIGEILNSVGYTE